MHRLIRGLKSTTFLGNCLLDGRSPTSAEPKPCTQFKLPSGASVLKKPKSRTADLRVKDAGDTEFAPAMLAWLMRAIKAGRKRERVKD